MATPKQEPKSAYSLIPVFIRGDRDYVDTLKSKAAAAHMPLADYLRKSADYAIANEESIFFADRGTVVNHTSKG